MQKFVAILGKVDANLNRVINIRRQWRGISGEVLAAHCQPVRIKGKSLQILCDSPAWVQQMNLLAETIKPRVRQLGGVKIDRIDARFGFVCKDVGTEQPPRKKWKPDIDPADVARIKSPELKNIFEEMLGSRWTDSEG